MTKAAKRVPVIAESKPAGILTGRSDLALRMGLNKRERVAMNSHRVWLRTCRDMIPVNSLKRER